MRNKKKLAALATGALVLGSAGVAYAYWTTTGTGTGAGTTTAGASDTLTFTQAALSHMYPGDSSQPLSVVVKNDKNAPTQSVYVSTVKAYITTDAGADCDGSNFSLGGAVDAVDADHAVTMTWVAQDLDVNDSDAATSTIRFNNKATDQDACKSAAVTIHYLAS